MGIETMIDEEYLAKCVVNTGAKNFLIYSTEGNERLVECETIAQFIEVLTYVRSVLTSETLSYVPLI